MSRYRLLSSVGLFASLAVVAQVGCGPSTNAGNAARVSGSISYKGAPIKGGVMFLHNLGTNISYPCQISADGTYSATDVGVGEMVVTVDTEPLKAAAVAAGNSAQAKARMDQVKASSRRSDAPGGGGGGPIQSTNPADLYVKIPAKYANPKTSPLSITLKPGRQVQNLELTD